jgi:hypothetical protein
MTRTHSRSPTVSRFSTQLFAGGVTVAAGNGDIVAGAGPGGTPDMNIYDSSTFALANNSFAFNPAFTGAITVAAGNGDLVVGAGPGGAPQVNYSADAYHDNTMVYSSMTTNAGTFGDWIRATQQLTAPDSRFASQDTGDQQAASVTAYADLNQLRGRQLSGVGILLRVLRPARNLSARTEPDRHGQSVCSDHR